jgi:hypothetical protein
MTTKHPKGTLSIREFYLACRPDSSVRESIRMTAEYKGLTGVEVAEALGFDPTFGALRTTCAKKGCKAELAEDYAKYYAYCPRHQQELLK